MLIGTHDGCKDDDKEAGSNGQMGQDGWREARILITEYEQGDHEDPSSDTEEPCEKTHNTSSQYEE